TADRLPLRRTH
ncbi:hypothetical protein ECTW15901_1067, partial [Escherichia coli TW15901]